MFIFAVLPLSVLDVQLRVELLLYTYIQKNNTCSIYFLYNTESLKNELLST